MSLLFTNDTLLFLYNEFRITHDTNQRSMLSIHHKNAYSLSSLRLNVIIPAFQQMIQQQLQHHNHNHKIGV